MAIKISGTTVINDSRNITDVENFGDANTVYTGNGANLTGISGGSKSFTASGAISDGRALLINSDGTVSQPTKSAADVSSVSAITTFTTSRSFDYAPVFDSTNNKVVIFYRDFGDSSKGKCVVATISGDSVSYGSIVQFESASTSDPVAAFDSANGKVVVFYSADSKGYAKVGTVSGTSITFGSRVEFNGGSTDLYGDSATYDPDEGKVIISYRDSGNSSYGTSRVGTVSGTSISFGSESVFKSATTAYISSTYDSTNGKVVVAFRDDGASSYGKIVGGDVSGTSISFDSGSGGISEKTFESGRADYIRVSHDPVGGVNLVVYQDDGDSQKGKAVPCRIDGNGFDLGSIRIFEESNIRNMGLAYDSTNKRHVVSYSDDGDSFQGRARAIHIDTLTDVEGVPTFGTLHTFTTGYTGHINSTYDSNADRTIITYIDDTPDNGESVLVDCSGMNVFNTQGGAVEFETGPADNMNSVYDPDSGKLIVTYRDTGNSNKGTLVMGTLTPSGITFGDPIVFNTTNTEHTAVTYDTTNNKIVIAFVDAGNSNKGKAIVGDVDGDTVVFGSVTMFNNAVTQDCDAIFDPDNEKVIISYRDYSDSEKGTAIVGTVSGTSISFGSEYAFTSNQALRPRLVYDTSNNKVVICYRHGGNSDRGTAIVATVSGSTISYGPAVVFQNNSIDIPDICFDSTNNKVVIAYRHAGNSNYGTAIVGTVSGTSISFGTKVVFDENAIHYTQIAYSPESNRVVISYRSSDTNGRSVLGKVDGTDFVFGPPIGFKLGNLSGGDHNMTSAHMPNLDKVIVSYKDNDGGNGGKSQILTVAETDITSNNFIGVAAEAISNSASGDVTIVGGINDSQSGLTTARKQYIQMDGTISTNNTGIEAGISISGTKISVGA